MKTCKKCLKNKELGEFAKVPRNSDGFAGSCKECMNARTRELYKENPERFKDSSSKWRNANRDRVRETDAAYRQDSVVKKRRIIHQNNRRAKVIGGTVTLEEWEALCNKYGNICLRCKEPKKLTQDHVIPLSLGGPHSIDNLQPLCLPCNAIKGNRSCTDYR